MGCFYRPGLWQDFLHVNGLLLQPGLLAGLLEPGNGLLLQPGLLAGLLELELGVEPDWVAFTALAFGKTFHTFA